MSCTWFSIYVKHFTNQGKQAWLSSTYGPPYPASKANDGIYIVSDDLSSLAHTKNGLQNPWWRVDLVSSYCVCAVNILNRALGM